VLSRVLEAELYPAQLDGFATAAAWLDSDRPNFVADHLVVVHQFRRVIGWSALAGTTALLVGGGLWVFVNPALHGPGFIVSTAGIVLLGVSIAATIVGAITNDPRLRLLPQPRSDSATSRPATPRTVHPAAKLSRPT
jgi:hypothetical protein